MTGLSGQEIDTLFEKLNEALRDRGVDGELYVVGGAVMCLVYDARPSTRDVDAFFRPTSVIRELAVQVGLDTGVGESWLNDAVKAFLSKEGEYTSYKDLENLKVYCAQPTYLLAMKCLAMRIGEEFHDLADIRYLLRYLNIERYDEALNVISQYYPLDRFPQKTLYALEELLDTTITA